MPDSRHFIAPFVGGLNTEQSDVQDLPATTSDELNCSIYPGLIRGRRYGMNIERDGQVLRMTTKNKPRVFQGYFWMNVAKTSTDFVVYQVDTMLYFYTAGTRPFSDSLNSAGLDISSYVTDINNFYNYPIKFITGGGYLMAVSKYMEPLKISYNFDQGQFDVEIINIQIRDLDGVPDGLKVDEVQGTLTDEHHYNLLNQGWTEANINAYHTAQNNYPPNNFQWFIGKDSSGNYSTTELLKHYFGNTPAPKGHFVVNYFNKNRAAVSGITSGSARTATYTLDTTWWG